MKQRAIFGIGAATLLTSCIFFAPIPILLLIVLCGAVLSYGEFDKLFFDAPSTSRFIRQLAVIIGSILFYLFSPLLALYAPFLVFAIGAIMSLVRANNKSDPVEQLKYFSLEWLGYSYVLSLFGFILPILYTEVWGREFLFLFFFMIFMGDTFAYLVGRKLGKHPLASVLSPKKSLEGAAASILGTLCAGVVGAIYIFKEPIDSAFTLRLILFSPILSILGQLGDLFESFLKRSRAKKDSGTFLPGHGGILDRIDGFVFAAPVYYIFIKWVSGTL